MENAAIDYQKLYEQSLLTISEKEENFTKELAKKEEKIASLRFELDKFRMYIFGKKSENPSIQSGKLDLVVYSSRRQYPQ